MNKSAKTYYYTELNGVAMISVSTNIFSSFPAHRHDFFEFELMTEGEVYCILNGEEHLLKAGDLVFVTPSDVHSYKGKNAVKTITVHFNPEGMNSSFNLFKLSSCVIHCKDNLTAEFYNLLNEYNSAGLLSDLALKNSLERIMILFLRTSNPSESTVADDGILSALSYINKNFNHPISLDDICLHCGYSPAYFCRLFKKTTGLTFVQYLNKIRLDCACRLLLTTDLSALQICFDCGFGSVRNFNRKFSERFGITPREYRVKICPPKD